MNLELVQILTSIRIWSFQDLGECRGDVIINYGCVGIECVNCPLFQSKRVAIYSNTLVKVIPL